MRNVMRNIDAGRGADFEVTNQQALSRTLSALCKRGLVRINPKHGGYLLTAEGRTELVRQGPPLTEVVRAVADFLAGPKDRYGRVDIGAGADDRARAARERIREFAVHYGVTGTGTTVLDQCAAVLRAAIQQRIDLSTHG